MPFNREPVKLFFSYAHEDEALRDALEQHLGLLKHERIIESWHDRKIKPGSDWARQIDDNLKSADIILLLVSAAFLDSDYCYGIEMATAMERHERDEARVIPVILKPCDWQHAQFSELSALPADGRPVTGWPNQDEAFLNVTRGIRNAADKIKVKQTAERQQQASPSSRFNYRKFLRAAARNVPLLASTLVTFLAISLCTALKPLDYFVVDSLFQWRTPLPAPPEITLIEIDETSLKDVAHQHNQRWPWRRDLHAKLIENVFKAGAAVIVFDVFFVTPKHSQADRDFIDAVSNNPDVILASGYDIKETPFGVEIHWKRPFFDDPNSSSDVSVGFNTVVLPDGVVRNIRLRVRDDYSLPYLAARRFAAKFPGRYRWQHRAETEAEITINFANPETPFRSVSYYQALDPSSFQLPAETFTNRLVFIGATTSINGKEDRFLTPLSRFGDGYTYGVEILANTAFNLLYNNDIKTVPKSLYLPVSFIVSVLLGLLIYKLGPAMGAAALLIASGLYFIVTVKVFSNYAYYYPLAYLLLPGVAVFLTSALLKYLQVRLRLRRAQKTIDILISQQQADVESFDNTTIKVLIIYSQKDATLAEKLIEALISLDREGFYFLTDKHIPRDGSWHAEIKAVIQESDIALTLVSQHFLDSQHCMAQINYFLQNRDVVIPIILSPCEWRLHEWVRSRQMLPGEDKTIMEHYATEPQLQRLNLDIRDQIRYRADQIRSEPPIEFA